MVLGRYIFFTICTNLATNGNFLLNKFAFFTIFSSEISYERIKAFFQVSIGILIPLLFFICFFFTKNALRSFLDGFLYIHISGVNNRTAVSIQVFLRFFFKHLGSNILFQFSYIYIFVHFFLQKF